MKIELTEKIVYQEGVDLREYQLRIGDWVSNWTYPSGLAALEALKAEVEADPSKADLIGSLR